MASGAVTGVPEGSKPRRFTYSCPSGNRPATWCAQYRASAVLPTPAIPPIALITTVPGRLAPAASRTWVSRRSSAARPVKSATAAGNCRGATPSPRWSAAVSRLSSKSAETFSARASLGRIDGSGSLSPRSQRTTVERPTATSSASAS